MCVTDVSVGQCCASQHNTDLSRMRRSASILLLLPLFVAGRPQLPLVRLIGETACLGAAITRHHVITPKHCMASRSSVMIEVVGKTGRRTRGSVLAWDHPSLALLGLERGLSGGGGLDLGHPVPGSVVVKGDGQELACSLDPKATLIQCEEIVMEGSLVLVRNDLIGLVGTEGSFYSIHLFLSSLSRVVGEDLARKSQAGGRGILRCRTSEKLAVQMLVASHGREKADKSEEVEEELMLRDDTRQLSSELTKVIQDLKSEIAGEFLAQRHMMLPVL